MTTRTSRAAASQSREAPYAPEAEESLLGAALLDRDAATTAVGRLKPADFTDQKRRLIFESVSALHHAGEGVDTATVAERLRVAGMLGDAGGKAHLLHLVSSCPSPANAETYARIVADNATRRDLITFAQHLSAEAMCESDPAEIGGRALVALEHMIRADAPATSRRLLTVDELDGQPALDYVARDFVVDRGLNIVYGPTGAYKSFLALDLACCVNAGLPWFGDRVVKRGPVVYVAAEGVAGMRQRVKAWRLENGSADLSTFYVVPGPIQLLDDGDVSAMIAAARTIGPRLLVVDTFARCMVGAEENSARDVGLAVASLDRMRDELGTAVLVVHHTGVDQTRERGSTALRAAADVAIAMRSNGESLVVESVKNKDGENALPLHLRRRIVDLPGLAAEDGRPLTSCVLEEIGAAFSSERAGTLLEILRECDAGEGVTGSEWMRLATDEGLARRTFWRGVRHLVEVGLVRREGQKRAARYSATEQGKDFACQ